MSMNDNGKSVKRCEGCEAEYVGDQFASCPLCPLRDNLEVAKVVVWQAEPFRIVEDMVRLEMQENINKLAASGWTLSDFFVGHYQNDDHGMPVFVALLRREDYDPERHRAAMDAQLKAFAEELAKRREVEVETEEFRAAHRLDADDPGC